MPGLGYWMIPTFLKDIFSDEKMASKICLSAEYMARTTGMRATSPSPALKMERPMKFAVSAPSIVKKTTAKMSPSPGMFTGR